MEQILVLNDYKQLEFPSQTKDRVTEEQLNILYQRLDVVLKEF
jgi:hypothetical protein